MYFGVGFEVEEEVVFYFCGIVIVVDLWSCYFGFWIVVLMLYNYGGYLLISRVFW